MSLFRRISRVEPAQIDQVELRLAKRFSIPAGSPLHAEVLVGSMGLPVRLYDLSTTGTRVAFAGDRAVAPGADCTVRLLIDDLVVKLVGSIANVHLTGGETQLGLKFGENKFEARQDLIQLLEPIEVGALLREVDPGNVKQTEPGFMARRYYSSGSTTLTLWRELEANRIKGFELHVREYFVRNGQTPPNLKVYVDDGTQAFGYAAPTLQQSGDVTAEVKRYFRWIVLHLGEKVSGEVKTYLESYAVLSS